MTNQALRLHEYQKYCVDRVVNEHNIGLLLDMG